jgi:hypothetical protein
MKRKPSEGRKRARKGQRAKTFSRAIFRLVVTLTIRLAARRAARGGRVDHALSRHRRGFPSTLRRKVDNL